MKTRHFFAGLVSLGLIALLAGVILLARRGFEAQSFAAPGTSTGKRVPVLVELFTSEGCSSCPPADLLLLRLMQTQPVGDAEIVVLEEHVDYWNRIGWVDPYSAETYTRRQNQYAEAFGLDSVYTPQAVVDGRAELVGSDERRLQQSIAQAARVPKATLTIERPTGAARGDALIFSVRAEGLGAAEEADVLIALTEDRISTDVPRGENAGRHLVHSAVMRLGVRVGEVKPPATAFSGSATLSTQPGWQRANLRVVAFVQERRSLRILGVAALPLDKVPGTPPDKASNRIVNTPEGSAVN
jgi:hypothetical protein